MKLLKRVIVALPAFLLLCVLCWFMYTRFLMPIYRMDGEFLAYRGVAYVRRDHVSLEDEDDLGRTIGIGIGDKRDIGDLIWPYWVLGYQNDAAHNSLFVRGLMGSGGKYEKIKIGNCLPEIQGN